jgi:exodeoxyribonuclease VII small subunit
MRPMARPAKPAERASSDAGEATETFESSTARLAQIVDELERGDLPLEKSLALFEEGVRLARTAQERIEGAERRVEELLGLDAQGKPVTRPLEAARSGDRSTGARSGEET